MSLIIRNAESQENCKYVLIDTNKNEVIKKYHEADEPVNFTAEVKKHSTPAEPTVSELKAQVDDINRTILDILTGGI